MKANKRKILEFDLCFMDSLFETKKVPRSLSFGLNKIEGTPKGFKNAIPFIPKDSLNSPDSIRTPFSRGENSQNPFEESFRRGVLFNDPVSPIPNKEWAPNAHEASSISSNGNFAMSSIEKQSKSKFHQPPTSGNPLKGILHKKIEPKPFLEEMKGPKIKAVEAEDGFEGFDLSSDGGTVQTKTKRAFQGKDQEFWDSRTLESKTRGNIEQDGESPIEKRQEQQRDHISELRNSLFKDGFSPSPIYSKGFSRGSFGLKSTQKKHREFFPSESHSKLKKESQHDRDKTIRETTSQKEQETHRDYVDKGDLLDGFKAYKFPQGELHDRSHQWIEPKEMKGFHEVIFGKSDDSYQSFGTHQIFEDFPNQNVPKEMANVPQNQLRNHGPTLAKSEFLHSVFKELHLNENSKFESMDELPKEDSSDDSMAGRDALLDFEMNLEDRLISSENQPFKERELQWSNFRSKIKKETTKKNRFLTFQRKPPLSLAHSELRKEAKQNQLEKTERKENPEKSIRVERGKKPTGVPKKNVIKELKFNLDNSIKSKTAEQRSIVQSYLAGNDEKDDDRQKTYENSTKALERKINALKNQIADLEKDCEKISMEIDKNRFIYGEMKNGTIVKFEKKGILPPLPF